MTRPSRASTWHQQHCNALHSASYSIGNSDCDLGILSCRDRHSAATSTRKRPDMSEYPQLKLYIGGEWKTASGAPVINPADESVLGTVPHATRADLDDALAAAGGGLKLWS